MCVCVIQLERNNLCLEFGSIDRNSDNCIPLKFTVMCGKCQRNLKIVVQCLVFTDEVFIYSYFHLLIFISSMDNKIFMQAYEGKISLEDIDQNIQLKDSVRNNF